MANEGQPAPALAVHEGDAVQPAGPIGDRMWMSRGIGNAYLVGTSDGDVVINPGMAHQAATNRQRFAEVSLAPVRAIVFTQGHANQVGGWSVFAEPGTETIAHENFYDVREYWTALARFYGRRVRVLWGGDIEVPAGFDSPPEPVLTTTFADSYAFEIGDRRFELYSTPGGETTDSIVVWLPQDRTVFIGNLMGPIIGHLPNLYTIRGDKIRSAHTFVRSAQRVIDLDPEVLLTGHGEPLRGAEIRVVISKVRDAVRYLRDRTFEGMDAGSDLFALMREVTLPADLALPEAHGKVPWVVRAIWEEYAGWFRFESTTELYDVPNRAVWADIVDLTGAERIIDRAHDHLEAGRPLEALHLTEITLAGNAVHRDALEVRSAALHVLLERSGRVNFSETRWLEAEIAATEAALTEIR